MDEEYALIKWPQKVRVCIECEDTIILSRAALASENQDKVYCTCDEVGIPMIPIDNKEDVARYLIGKELRKS